MVSKSTRGERHRARAASGRAARSKWVPSAEAAAREIRRTRRMRYRKHRRRVFMVLMALALAAGIALSRFTVEIVNVRGTGMSPALETGEVVLCISQSFLDKTVGLLPQSVWRIGRGDLVVIDYRPESETGEDLGSVKMIKRVIGVGGDVIDVRDGVMTVNGETVEGAAYGSDRAYPYTVPSKRLFLMGDHRSVAVDSRKKAFGVVSEADVTARPVAVVWPVFAIGPAR